MSKSGRDDQRPIDELVAREQRRRRGELPPDDERSEVEKHVAAVRRPNRARMGARVERGSR